MSMYKVKYHKWWFWKNYPGTNSVYILEASKNYVGKDKPNNQQAVKAIISEVAAQNFFVIKLMKTESLVEISVQRNF